MKTADVDILTVPGWTGAGPDHWMTRWERGLKTARRIEQADWDRPVRADWVERIVAAVDRATRPVVLVGHSCGASAIVHAMTHLRSSRVVGALLVAIADLDDRDRFTGLLAELGPSGAFPAGFTPLPELQMPVPAVLIASSDDPFCSPERAAEFAQTIGATLVEGGALGHVNTASGHGPWPDGLLRLGTFLRQLGPAPQPH